MNRRSSPTLRKGYRVGKRLTDVALTILAALTLWPLMLILAVLVRLQDGGPALYSQMRLGQGGKLIRVWKFRSMIPDAEQQMNLLTAAQQASYRREYKVEADPRVTRLGSILRRTGLDELPQLWNILKGEMSLVGPRPVVPEEISNYTEEERQLFQSVLPGLTGYWQVHAGTDDTYATGNRQKMELHYAASATLGGDLLLMLQTFSAVVRRAKRGE